MAPSRPPTPDEQAQQVGAEVEEAIAVALSAAVAAAGGYAAIQVAGYTYESLRVALVALFRPLAVARVYYIAQTLRQNYTDSLPTGPEPFTEMIEELFEREAIYERIFVERSTRRIVADLERSKLDGDTPEQRRTVLEGAIARELRFERMRQLAVRHRIMAGVSEARVRAISPEGAYWRMDPTKKTHTADCLAMNGKAWSWSVLAVIRPSNRHHQCGCVLIPLGMARAHGLPGANVIRSSAPKEALSEDH